MPWINTYGGVIINKIEFRFYAELNNFIDIENTNNLELAGKINKPIVNNKYYIHYYRGHPSIKDRVESLGIPHTEIALILKNGNPVEFSYLVQKNDQFSIYPYFYNIKLPEDYKLQEEYPLKPKFILDVHLGKLARFLRRFNFDTLYSNSYSDSEIVEIAEKENRIILTRDLGLLMRKKVKWGCFIKYDDPQKQLKQVFKRYDLAKYYKRKESRCVDCNTILIDIDKEKIMDRLEEKTKRYFDEFKICPDCSKVYWRGSHYHQTENILEVILDNDRLDKK